MPGGKATLTRVSFRGSKRNFHTAKEAYVWILDKFVAEKPDIPQAIHAGNKRPHFARSVAELFPDRPDLAETRTFYEKIAGGWFADVNISNETKRELIIELASVGGFERGIDWTWDDGSKP